MARWGIVFMVPNPTAGHCGVRDIYWKIVDSVAELVETVRQAGKACEIRVYRLPDMLDDFCWYLDNIPTVCGKDEEWFEEADSRG